MLNRDGNQILRAGLHIQRTLAVAAAKQLQCADTDAKLGGDAQEFSSVHRRARRAEIAMEAAEFVVVFVR